ncbi:MAG: ABC1 kinase family protein [Thalassobaculaceae bacterium]|jgi:predicted unusual protein kinase regulating ubiquinone biosynthesis (AarF/ABC1/UbiB family)|nr:ABC transporter ATP-binding protein [Rhodospirillaceae bacterium]OUU54239.1 MAG: ABC transporter ATP-binding protein [Candidatus Endolissoclinum sp. TMED55]
MDNTENNSLSGRIKRYAKVTGAVGGIAARVAGQRYLGLNLGKQEMPADLKSALGNLKGPVMKVAQILATIPDALPDEYVEELRQLQSNAPSMGRLFVKRRMSAELGKDWQNSFNSFNQEAVAAASLGQVHKAESLDGKTVACKLQYPDMNSAVEADLKQLRLAMSIYQRYDNAINASEIYKELSARIREELDYIREGRNMALYRLMLAKEETVHVPDLIETASTDRLLTMTWLDGVPVLDFIKNNPELEMRNLVAKNMFRAWYVPFYLYGIIHGDPHLGNYSIRPNGDINLLDFGCIRIFPPTFVKGVIDLYIGLRDSDEELAVNAYRTWGFENLDRDTIDVLNHWARFVYSPLMEDKVRRIQETNSGVYGKEVVEKVHKELRRLNGVKPPREFVLMDRAAIGLGSVFLHLNAEVNWYNIFQELISDFDVSEVAYRQNEALTTAKVPTAL